jgi:cell division FtsZ-interacting protein ZapD
MKGRFDEKSAGGNPTHASWIHNPQLAFAVDSLKPMQLQATIQASKSLPLNLKLIRQAGQADSRVMQ